MATKTMNNKVENKGKTKKIVRTNKNSKVKATRKAINFNKFSIYFQSISIILAIAALTLNVCNCIDMSIMIDLFGLSVIFLAFSLLKKKSK